MPPKYRQAKYEEPLLIELSNNKQGITFPDFKEEFGNDYSLEELIPKNFLRKELNLPQISELEIITHFTRLSQMNFGVDSGFYPLGSCTMKYNPKICEEIVNCEEVQDIHPYQNEETVQGALQIMYELGEYLKEIAGMDAITLQPNAGAHGELTGMLITKAYHELKKEDRTEVILPNTSHGTNPASASMVGYDVIEIPSLEGCVDLQALKSALSKKTSAFMITNPNTLGIFEKNIAEISKMVHEVGALLYYDGANLNAIMGKTSPGKMGFDIVHFNLHKTFSTPHGGGGPGSGPIGVKKHLAKFLPIPIIEKIGEQYKLNYNLPNSIGKVSSFYGNFSILLRAYIYIKLLGGNGLREVSEIAVLNANYVKEKLKQYYEIPYGNVKHEFVMSGKKFKEKGIKTLDIAKRILDYGFHSPSIYFPHLVEEAIMVEPTESESKETLDRFINAMIEIANENADIIKNAPYNTSVRRVDEVSAVKNLVLNWNEIK